MTQLTTDNVRSPAPGAFPLRALLVLATAAFITSLTEALPAGVLPEMADTLRVTPAAAGQTITVYALGTFFTVVPLAAWTATWHRRTTLILAMTGFLVANTVTAAVTNYWVTLSARAVAGIAAGLAWSLLAGYARRLATGHEGRAIAVAMLGIPIALSLGVPAGSYLGSATDWRIPFVAISVLAVCTTVAIGGWVPDVDGDGPHRKRRAGREVAPPRVSPLGALRVPGVLAVLVVTGVVVLAHTVLYTYSAEYLAWAHLGARVGSLLLVFGIASLVSIWLVGRHVDRSLRSLTMGSAAVLAVAFIVLISGGAAPAAVVWVAVAVWGLGWGGIPTLLQTAVARAGSARSAAAADLAQALLVTVWNGAMAAGGLLGGALLGTMAPSALPIAAAALVIGATVLVVSSRRHGFASRQALSDPPNENQMHCTTP